MLLKERIVSLPILDRFFRPLSAEQTPTLAAEKQLRAVGGEIVEGRGARRVYAQYPDPDGYKYEKIQAWINILQQPDRLSFVVWEHLNLGSGGLVLVCQTDIVLGNTNDSEPKVTVRDRKLKSSTKSDEWVTREVTDLKERDELLVFLTNILKTGKPQDEIDPMAYNSLPRPPA